MEPVQRRNFLKNMGGIAATAAMMGTTLTPVAKAAGLTSSNSHQEGGGGCWDNDHSCQYQSCCYDSCIDEQFDYCCYFEICCKTDEQNQCCFFDVECYGSGQSCRKTCNDGRKKKHHWKLRSCEQKGHCKWNDGCEIDLKVWCHCKDDDGCGYKDHCFNFCVYCFVDQNGCCCYSIQCKGITAS